MSKVALVVELGMVPGRRDAFLERARRHAKTCLEEEAGCLRFDILVSEEAGDQVFLYEVYADHAAPKSLNYVRSDQSCACADVQYRGFPGDLQLRHQEATPASVLE